MIRRQRRRAVEHEVFTQRRALHHVDGLLKLIEVVFEIMMQVGADGGGRDAFAGADKQRVVKLVAQALQRLAYRRGREKQRFSRLADAAMQINAFKDNQKIEVELFQILQICHDSLATRRKGFYGLCILCK
ncbi:hypothetical protein BN133_4163 [Cronobacter dublinensis 582]|nr:hypothetical protein BN133_4163 [Cronobacter dublinensis 582]